VQRLPSNGATAGAVIFSAGTYPSGYSGSDRITTANLTLQGAAMPNYNSDLTALAGGTIITGTLPVGADYFTARDLGVDVGAKVAGSTAIDGFVMANNGQVIGQAPFKNPVLENVAVLGVNVPGAHTILIENVTGAYVHKIRCRYQTHCFAFKGDGVIDTIDAAGGSVENIVIKSDNYAPSGNVTISHVTMGSITPGDSGGLMLQALDADLKHIVISDVVGTNIRYGLKVIAADPFSISDVSASGLAFDDSGFSSGPTYCLQEGGSSPGSQSINGLNISYVTCKNFVQVQNIDSQYVQNGTLTNVSGVNISYDAFWNNGSWQMSNIFLNTVAGNGVVALGGVTTIKGTSFTNIAGSAFVEMGGQIVVEKP
jgi:hypothetical protein